VNDFANVINETYEAGLNSLIGELERKTTAEIAVVTVDSIAPYDEKEYARLLFDNWKPGKKGKDNGVLVLLAIQERRWRIETGYGIEGILPDGLCGEIGRNYMVPYFKTGDYGAGLYQGVQAIAAVIARDANITLGSFRGAEAKTSKKQKIPISLELLFFIFIAIVIIRQLLDVDNYSGGRNDYGGYYGGGFGGGGGGFGGFGGGGGGGGGAGGGF
jgi:uncharacterized protein